MSSEPWSGNAGAVSLRGLGKAYRLYDQKWGRAAEWLGLGKRHHLHWVLREVDLDIGPGDSVGIIGENGAGKSTLLKIITGVSPATTGHVNVHGRVAALLELGVGFHGDFSGRENAINTLRLSGVSDAEIPVLLPGIEAFADLGEYFHYPLRTYSSGMQVRLAFATVTAVRPDVLIVDEALAVGDVFFQQRCFDRIHAFREAGTTLLFVSHAVATVFALCDRAILLRGGRVISDGAPREVIDLYNAQMAARASDSSLTIAGDASAGDAAATEPGSDGVGVGSYGNGSVRLQSVVVLQHGRSVSTVAADSDLALQVRVLFSNAVADPHVGFQLRDRRGEVLYRAHTHGLGLAPGAVEAGETLEVEFAFAATLAPGDYTVTVGVACDARPGGAVATSLLRVQDVARFTIARNPGEPYWDGRVNLKPVASCRSLQVTPR
jgi:lipopolysaccharide transport system ATP-binding protein